jgi:hypothetical protein
MKFEVGASRFRSVSETHPVYSSGKIPKIAKRTKNGAM